MKYLRKINSDSIPEQNRCPHTTVPMSQVAKKPAKTPQQMNFHKLTPLQAKNGNAQIRRAQQPE